jgi:ethanolamine utilization protein EutA
MADSKDAGGRRAHTVSDHLYGFDPGHVHDGDADHDHDDLDPGPLEENPIWIADHVTLTSVGIDIGSSGTQVVFSRVRLRRLGEELTSRYHVIGRETLYQSPVSLTPYQSEQRIDDAALAAIIATAYREAGLSPAEIDTGAVILTGEALRRENAEPIAGMLAAQGGDLVCATAGHHMEAMLAAYGSGAARVSSDRRMRLLNIDIGGGTTKLAVIAHGQVVATAAVHIGGRLQVVDAGGRIVRLDPAGRRHAAAAGFDWHLGDCVRPEELDRVAESMADALVGALTARPLPAGLADLYLTEPIADFGPIAGVMVSGGVGEYVYDRETRDFGDLGRRLGLALRHRFASGVLPWPLMPAGECIRATALGASAYSMQLSGNTCTITSPGTLLPRRNLQVVQPPYLFGEQIDAEALGAAIRCHLEAFDIVEGETEVALAFRWQGPPSHARLSAFARGLALGLPRTIAAGKPLYIMLDGDVAQTLGAVLREEFAVAGELLVLDGLTLTDFDYVDLGKLRLPSMTVPVTIKSLLFRDDPRNGADFAPRHARRHGHPHRHHRAAGPGQDHAHGHGHDHDHDHGHAHAQRHDHARSARHRHGEE